LDSNDAVISYIESDAFDGCQVIDLDVNCLKNGDYYIDFFGHIKNRYYTFKMNEKLFFYLNNTLTNISHDSALVNLNYKTRYEKN
jgi:hypothetical protein